MYSNAYQAVSLSLFARILVLHSLFLLSACGDSTSSKANTDLTTANQSSASNQSVGVSQALPDCPFGAYQNDVLIQVNNLRTKGAVCGATPYPAVGPLKWNAKLALAGDMHSYDMAFNNFFDHRSATTGKTVTARLVDVGYPATLAGENLGAGQDSAQSVVAAWAQSPPHCANMMDGTYREMAVSCKTNPAAAFNYYWTQVLGSASN